MDINDNRIGSLDVSVPVYVHPVCRRIGVSVMDIPDFQNIYRECVGVVQMLRDLIRFQMLLLKHFTQKFTRRNSPKETKSVLSLDTYRLADAIS